MSVGAKKGRCSFVSRTNAFNLTPITSNRISEVPLILGGYPRINPQRHPDTTSDSNRLESETLSPPGDFDEDMYVSPVSLIETIYRTVIENLLIYFSFFLSLFFFFFIYPHVLFRIRKFSLIRRHILVG